MATSDHDEKIAAYNAALAEGRTEDAKALADELLTEIHTRIMAEDDYQGRQRIEKGKQ